MRYAALACLASARSGSAFRGAAPTAPGDGVLVRVLWSEHGRIASLGRTPRQPTSALCLQRLPTASQQLPSWNSRSDAAAQGALRAVVETVAAFGGAISSWMGVQTMRVDA